MIKKIMQWLKRLLHGFQEVKGELKATEVIDEWCVIKYHDQNICLRKREINWWNRLNRKDRRAMALRFKIQEKKGIIRFENINGKLVCIKNKDYNAMVKK